MGMFSALKKAWTAARIAVKADSYATLLDIPGIERMMQIDEKNPLSCFAVNSTAFRSVSMVADAGAGIRWKLMQKNSEGSEEISEHPILDLIERPNSRQSFQRFMSLVLIHLQLSPKGVFILQIGPETGENAGFPQEFHLLPSKDMEVKEAKDMSLTFKRNDTGEVFDESEVLWLNLPHPSKRLSSLPPASAALLPAMQVQDGALWNRQVLKNSGRPAGLITFKRPVDVQTENRYREQFDALTSKLENFGKNITVPGDILSYQQLSQTMKELSWLEGMVYNNRQTALSFGVPPQLVGDTDSQTYSNYKEARRALYTETVVPKMDYVCGEFSQWLMPRISPKNSEEKLFLTPAIDEITVLQEDVNELWDRAKEANCLTIDERRELLDFEELEDKETGSLILSGGKPINGSGNEEGKEPSKEPEEKNEKGWGFFVPNRSVFNSELHVKALDSKRNSHEFRMAAGIAGIFQEQLEFARKVFRDQPSVDNALEEFFAGLRNFEDQFVKTISSEFAEVAVDFSDTVADQSQVIMRTKALREDVIARARMYVENYGREPIHGMSESTKVQLKRAVSKVLREGGDPLEEIQNRYVKGYIPKRSLTVARTQIVAASNFGTQLAALSSGLPLQKTWNSLLDNNERHPHREADGQTRGLNKSYLVDGEQLLFPGDVSLGASAGNIINCRCFETYEEGI